jgi:hypothetical protein
MRTNTISFKIAFMAVLLLLNFQANAQQKRFQQVTPQEISEKQTSLISDKLELNEKETKQLKQINLKYATEMKAVRDQGRSRENRQKLEALNHAQNEEVQNVLNKEKFEKYLVLKKDMQRRMEMKVKEERMQAKLRANDKKRERFQERQAFLEKLDLSDDQKDDLKEIGQKYDEQREAIRVKGSPAQNRSKMEAIRQAQNEEVQKVLNEDQFKLYLEMQEERLQRMNKERGKQRGMNRN